MKKYINLLYKKHVLCMVFLLLSMFSSYSQADETSGWDQQPDYENEEVWLYQFTSGNISHSDIGIPDNFDYDSYDPEDDNSGYFYAGCVDCSSNYVGREEALRRSYRQKVPLIPARMPIVAPLEVYVKPRGASVVLPPMETLILTMSTAEMTAALAAYLANNPNHPNITLERVREENELLEQQRQPLSPAVELFTIWFQTQLEESLQQTLGEDNKPIKVVKPCPTTIGYLHASNFEGTVVVGIATMVKEDNFRDANGAIIDYINCESGKIPKGTHVAILHATPERRAYKNPDGTVAGQSMYYKVSYTNCEGGNVNTNADFKPGRPCNDCFSGNPVTKPVIQGTTDGGTRAGLFGKTGGQLGTSRYGAIKHGGVNIKRNVGATIYAMFDGTATKHSESEGLGKYVVITSKINGDEIKTYYGHMQDHKRASGEVKAGDVIGYQGTSGNLGKAVDTKTTLPHVHIKIKKNGKVVDPLPYFKTTFNPQTGAVLRRGSDCDDTEAECEKKKWYLDNDGDGYHSDTEESCDKPGDKWKQSTSGTDCDDTDAGKTENCDTQSDPCKNIKEKFANNNTYKDKYDALNSSTNFNKRIETGFAEKNEGTLIDLGNNGRGTMEFTPDRTWRGASHVHNNNWTTVKDGIRYENQTVKIHSPTDINQFLALAALTRVTNEPIEDVYIDVLASTGNYTIKFNGTKEDFTNNVPSNIKPDSNDNIEKYLELTEEHSFDPEAIILNFLEELNLDKFISLYKIEKDDNGEYIPKQVIKNTNGTIEYKNC